MKKTLLSFLLLFSAVTGYAKQGLPDFIHYVDGIYYQYIDGKAWVSRSAHYGYQDIILWDFNCYSGELVIPKKVEGYTVVGILESAFDRCDKLTSITFPSTIKTIGDYAFYNLTALTELTIPATIESIGEGAFNSSGLKKLTIADSDKPLKLDRGNGDGEAMFSFQKVASLEEVYIGRPIEITRGATNLFYNCNIKKVTVGSSVTEIPDRWFHWCSNLQQFSATSKLKRIGNQAFDLCKELTSFKANGLKEIGDYAFSQCKKLSKLTLSKLTTIGANVFYGTTALTELTIPASVTSIGEGAFNSSGLKKLTFADGDKPLKLDRGNGDGQAMFSFQKVAGLEEVYIGRPIEITRGATNLFYNSNIKKVTVGSSVAEIPDEWFHWSALQQFTATSNLKRIGSQAFNLCKDLTSFKADGLEEIGDRAFSQCGNLSELILSPKLTTIGVSAFSYTTVLTELTIPASVTSIGDEAFYSSGLKEMTCLATVPPACGKDVFRYCSTSKLKVPAKSVAAYKAAAPWNSFANIAGITIKVKLNKTKATLLKDKTLTLKATVTPTDLADKSVTWKSSNKKVATVSSKGKVTAVKAGTATITCTNAATGAKATCKVTVIEGVVTLNATELFVEKDLTKTLKATVTPETLDDKSVTWTTSNKKIATVSSKGKVKGVKYGTVTITCTSVATGAKATCTVTVGDVTLSKSELSVKKGKTVKLTATVYPTTLEDQSVTWKSSNKKIATVSSAGKVKGIKAGTVTITCTSVATGLSATCTVTVVNASSTRSLEGDDDDETTGIESLEAEPAETEPFDVYDLSGRKVLTGVTSLDGLPNGVYIVNGKKMLKK